MAILYPTSLANLVVEVGTRHCHQTLFRESITRWSTESAGRNLFVLKTYQVARGGPSRRISKVYDMSTSHIGHVLRAYATADEYPANLGIGKSWRVTARATQYCAYRITYTSYICDTHDSDCIIRYQMERWLLWLTNFLVTLVFGPDLEPVYHGSYVISDILFMGRRYDGIGAISGGGVSTWSSTSTYT